MSTHTVFDLSESQSLFKENQTLKEGMLCKICLDKDACMVYLPCGHMVTCQECAPTIRKCCICRKLIHGTVKAYLWILSQNDAVIKSTRWVSLNSWRQCELGDYVFYEQNIWITDLMTYTMWKIIIYIVSLLTSLRHACIFTWLLLSTVSHIFIMEKHISDWKALITDASGRRGYGRNKLHTYKLFTSEYAVEEYCKIYSSPKI